MNNTKETRFIALPEGEFCWNSWEAQGYCCRDCRYLEMDADAHGLRRCAYFGKWVRPAEPACGNFAP